jgi:hypothetical protein
MCARLYQDEPHGQGSWRDGDGASEDADAELAGDQRSAAVGERPLGKKAAQLHMANVRLYASKMRSDAKMCSLAADLEAYILKSPLYGALL